MDEREQIVYMQARISRMAAQRWKRSLKEVMELFSRCDTLGYIERHFGLLHLEGDDAVLDDVIEYMVSKGVSVDAGAP